MNRFTLSIACFVVSLLAPLQALAFKLNPCLRVLTAQQDALGQEAIRIVNPCDILPDQLKYAVHEHMSVAAIAKYRNKKLFHKGVSRFRTLPALNYMRPDSWRVGNGRLHDTTAIVFGTWWNDDPHMYLLGGGEDFRAGVRKFRELFSANPGPTLRSDLSCNVPIDQHLGYRSHFGSLQHIHFMTSLDKSHSQAVRLKSTIDAALVWIEFAYNVATQDRKATDAWTQEDEMRLGLPSLAKNLCLTNAANTKIRSLFSRQGPATLENLTYRNRITPDVALGSIFHVLQDSFSPAHACRVRAQIGGQSVAVLREVFNYNEQNHKRHAEQDGYPDWLLQHARDGKHLYANDPVAVSAWLLGAVDAATPWEEVKTHLLNTVFLQQSPDRTSVDQACIR